MNHDDPKITSPANPNWGAPPVARALSVPQFPNVPMPRLLAGLDLFLIVGFFFFCQDLLAISGLPKLLVSHFPQVGIFGVNIVLGGAILAAIYVLLKIRRQNGSAIGMGRTSFARLAVGTLIAVPLCYVAVLIAVPLYVLLMGMSMEDMMAERSVFFDMVPEMPRWVIVPLAMFIGLHEEALFRGFILGRLRALLGSTAAAVAISTVIFGALHAYQGMIGVIQTGTVGLVLALVAVRCRSIWPAVLAHGIFNTIGLTLIPWLQETFGELMKQPTTTTAPM